MTEVAWTKETVLEAGHRVWEALGYWPSRRQWKELARVAREAGEPLPTLWYVQKFFGGLLSLGRAVGAIEEPPEPELPPLSELLPERPSRPLLQRRIPLPTPPGASTYIFSRRGCPVAIIIDLIPPEPEWEFDQVTIIPWGYDGRTRELTRRLDGEGYRRRRERELAELMEMAKGLRLDAHGREKGNDHHPAPSAP